ncbi:transcriptional regulator [Candidatus Bathyarchaeota archaeon]|nr:transcriptional regulator [Candidatus Bathyarchaeota archaeon]
MADDSYLHDEVSTPGAVREALAQRIVGEIVLSSSPGTTLRKWREIFSVKTTGLAERMRISPSVVSDYEANRRSPGARFLRRFVEGLFALDEEQGGRVLRRLANLTEKIDGAVIDMKEFPIPLRARRLVRAVDGVIVAGRNYMERNIYGYTILDSIRAIETLSGADFYQILGATSERALVFTNVSTGRSPMVAIRVQTIKPKMVIVHGTGMIDRLAGHLAELEHIPLVLSSKPSAEALVDALNALYLVVRSRRSRNKGEGGRGG